MGISKSNQGRVAIGFLAAASIALGGCTSTVPKLGLGGSKGYYARNGKTSGPEFFSSRMLGVNASPRVGTGPRLRRGGGRDQVGKPYTVNGKTYTPTENPKKVQVGRASWYGAAFHGRLTANGEVYDMNHLTAAHKTMPLPSYARVTNLQNGRSLIVRVNDRGPFADDRVIDLSKRAADLLDYSHDGTAEVKVEYAGRAPLDGHDDAFLMASVRGVPGSRSWDGIAQPASGVAIAMNGPTPRVAVSASAGQPGPMPGGMITGSTPADTSAGSPFDSLALNRVPLPVARPSAPVRSVAVSAYADMRVSDAFGSMDIAGTVVAWK